MSELSILTVTNMWPNPEKPDFGTFVQEQVEGLRDSEYSVDVLFVNGKESRLNYLRAISELRKKLNEKHYDLVHAHYVLSGIVARFQRQIPVVVSYHGGGESVGYQGQLCKWLAPYVDRVTVTSKEHHEIIGYPAAKIIPCGVNLSLFQPGDKQEARQQLNLPVAKKLVLFCGDPRPEKRVPLIKAAVKKLQQTEPDVEFVMAVGSAPQRDSNLDAGGGCDGFGQ